MTSDAWIQMNTNPGLLGEDQVFMNLIMYEP